MKIKDLENKSNIIRKLVCEMCLHAESGHPNSSLSCVDLLTVIFFSEYNKNLDSFILSKGHAAPALYSVFIANGFLKKEFSLIDCPQKIVCE